MGAERESAVAKATADKWQANASGRLKSHRIRQVQGVNARIFRGNLSPLRGGGGRARARRGTLGVQGFKGCETIFF